METRFYVPTLSDDCTDPKPIVECEKMLVNGGYRKGIK